MPTYVRDGDVTVSLDGDLDRWARDAVDACLPGVLDLCERAIDETLEDAKFDWPVKTGRSRAALHRASVIALGDGVEVQIRSQGVPYAFYIKPRVLHGADTAWNRYVKKPVRAVAEKLAERLAPVIAEGVAAAGRGSGSR